MKPSLHLVRNADRPLANLSKAEKIAQAIGYLRSRGLYVLDQGTPRPKWGISGEVPKDANPLLAKIADMDRTRR